MSRKFSHAEYDSLVSSTIEQVKKLGSLKGGENAGDDDRLANFRRNGLDLGLPMEVIWRVYAVKHWDAIGQYIKDILHGKNRERMESLTGRVDDLIVYALLLKAMLVERERVPLPKIPRFDTIVQNGNQIISKAPKDF